MNTKHPAPQQDPPQSGPYPDGPPPDPPAGLPKHLPPPHSDLAQSHPAAYSIARDAFFMREDHHHNEGHDHHDHGKHKGHAYGHNPGGPDEKHDLGLVGNHNQQHDDEKPGHHGNGGAEFKGPPIEQHGGTVAGGATVPQNALQNAQAYLDHLPPVEHGKHDDSGPKLSLTDPSAGNGHNTWAGLRPDDLNPLGGFGADQGLGGKDKA